MPDESQVPPDPLERAKAAVGGAVALGPLVGVTPQAVTQWKRVPPRRVLAVEKATGVPRHELRPDMYPPPEGVAA